MKGLNSFYAKHIPYVAKAIKECVSCHSFYSLVDFAKQLTIHNRRSNNFPMRPLGWRSPSEFTVQYV